LTKEKSESKPIAFHDGMIERENLPNPIVLYPGFYGAFFGFREKEDSPIILCSCAKEAIENYLRLRLSAPVGTYIDPRRMSILESMYFPLTLVETLMKNGAPNDYRIIYNLTFRNRLCHECNRSVPKYRYCHEMNGSSFTQTYGWYINKQAFEWGIEPISLRYLKDECPLEVRELFDEKLMHHSRYEISVSRTLAKRWRKQERAVLNCIENTVRDGFKVKRIGESWISETVLYYLIESMLKDKQVLRHYRPGFLEGLELDIFIPNLNIGIEYQGLQHFKAVKHWGGEEAFRRTHERDRRKKELSDLNNIKLAYFFYNERITEELVKERLGI